MGGDYNSTCSSRWKKVEVPESIGGDEGVRVDDDGEEADDGECGEEDDGHDRDGSLHQAAVGGESRDKSYWGRYCEKECQQKIILLMPFCLLVEEDKVAEDNNDDEGHWADHIVAHEGTAHCQCKNSEDQVGGEEDSGLDCFDKCWLF